MLGLPKLPVNSAAHLSGCMSEVPFPRRCWGRFLRVRSLASLPVDSQREGRAGGDDGRTECAGMP